MLDVLAQGERSVDELAAATSLGRERLPAPEGAPGRGARGGARVADVGWAAREYLGDDVEAVGREELMARLRAGGVTPLDVRPRAEFAAGHIRGARSVPLAEPEARMAEIPEGDEVVAYCWGPCCVYAHEAVRRLEGGWPQWRLAGLPVATGARGAGAPPRR